MCFRAGFAGMEAFENVLRELDVDWVDPSRSLW